MDKISSDAKRFGIAAFVSFLLVGQFDYGGIGARIMAFVVLVLTLFGLSKLATMFSGT
jgi:hypothetical protein